MDSKQIVLDGMKELWKNSYSPFLSIADYVEKWGDLAMPEENLEAFEELSLKDEIVVVEEFIKWVKEDADNGQQY